jgi:hypothetical protein
VGAVKRPASLARERKAMTRLGLPAALVESETRAPKAAPEWASRANLRDLVLDDEDHHRYSPIKDVGDVLTAD